MHQETIEQAVGGAHVERAHRRTHPTNRLRSWVIGETIHYPGQGSTCKVGFYNIDQAGVRTHEPVFLVFNDPDGMRTLADLLRAQAAVLEDARAHDPAPRKE